jgi:DNA-binding response OmpR family regulator
MPPPRPKTGHILHLELDPEWVRRVGRWVRGLGLDYQALGGRAELRERLSGERERPLCVILDARLGAEDGLAICESLKSAPASQAVPIVVLTDCDEAPERLLERGALHAVRKDARAESMLGAVLRAVLSQHDKSQGVIEAGDIQLDPRDRTVLIRDVSRVSFHPGPFAAFRRLVTASPDSVPDSELYAVFLERHAYAKPDHQLSERATLRNYVSRLRLDLGPRVGRRIVRLAAGYAYVPDKPLPRL